MVVSTVASARTGCGRLRARKPRVAHVATLAVSMVVTVALALSPTVIIDLAVTGDAAVAGGDASGMRWWPYLPAS